MSGDSNSGDGSTGTPDFSELGQSNDVVGEFTTRSVQSMLRVDIPDSYMDHLGLEKGDKIMVHCREDEVAISEATVQKVRGDD